MKFFTLSVAVALLAAPTQAVELTRHHHHHAHKNDFVQTLPDVRDETVTEADIAARELARATAAKVTKNPQESLLATVQTDLDQINKDVSFGVSFSQSPRNTHARELCVKISSAIKDYADAMIAKVDTGNASALAETSLTEQNAHNIASLIFYDVQLQDYMGQLGMASDAKLVLAVNRLKSLQKLYLFEQPGGENYLD